MEKRQKQFSIRLPQELLLKAVKVAEADNRSLADYVRLLVIKAVSTSK